MPSAKVVDFIAGVNRKTSVNIFIKAIIKEAIMERKEIQLEN